MIRLDLDVVLGSLMVEMYSKNGLHARWERCCVQYHNHGGFSLLEEVTPRGWEALGLFPEIRRKRIRLSKFTFSSILRACNFNEGI